MIYPIDLDQLREDEIRAEIATAAPGHLAELVIDGIYTHAASTHATKKLSDERVAALFAALRAEDAANRLPTPVALAWDRVIASVIANTLAHRARPVFPMPGRSPGQLTGDCA